MTDVGELVILPAPPGIEEDGPVDDGYKEGVSCDRGVEEAMEGLEGPRPVIK